MIDLGRFFYPAIVSFALTTVIQLADARHKTVQGRTAADSSTLRSDLLDVVRDPTFALNPHGTAVAFIRWLPLRSTIGRLGDEPVNELWIARAPKWIPVRIEAVGNLPHTVSNLAWSGDGRRLSYLLRQGRATRLAVWDDDARAKYVSPCFVGPFSEGYTSEYYSWLDRDRILTWKSPASCHWTDSMPAVSSFPDIASAMRDWYARAYGRHATVSVMSTEGLRGPGPSTSVVMFHVTGQRFTTLAEGPISEVVAAAVSDRVAVLERQSWQLPVKDAALLWRSTYARQVVKVIDLSTKEVVAVIDPGQAILPSTLTWSPDGRQVAMAVHDWSTATPGSCAVAYRELGPHMSSVKVCGEIGDRPWVMDIRYTRNTADYSSPAANGLSWTSDGVFLVRMRDTAAADSDRFDWYLTGDGAPRNITRSLREIPFRLVTIGTHTYCAADGRLWEFTRAAGGDEQLTTVEVPASETILSIRDGAQSNHSVRFQVSTNSSGVQSPTLSLVDISERTVRHYSGSADVEPVGNAAIGAAVPTWIGRSSNTDSTSYFLYRGQQVLKRLLTVPRIEKSVWVRQRLVFYRAANGDTLSALLTLPLHYQSGKPYPTVVWVYPLYGHEVTWNPPPDSVPLSKNDDALWPPHLASLGYAVLQTTAHFSDSSGHQGLFFADLAHTVLPAVDEIVRLGIADSTRLGLIGHSAGGYSVMGLLTQTRRFRAAVALAGPTNFSGVYGEFETELRHDEAAPYDSYNLAGLESGQFGMEGPPWAKGEAYMRNSPLFSADKITTPLLIIQGDEDVVPVSQGEAMFSALYRQGKIAELVRYWGEGHVVTGYYNQVDEDKRIGAWFARFLRR